MKFSIHTIPYIIFLFLTISINDSKRNIEIKKTKPPCENFDLKNFKLSLPSDDNEDGKSDNISVKKLNADYESEYFYTAEDGGMVFKCPTKGAKISKNTKYVRTELREM